MAFALFFRLFSFLKAIFRTFVGRKQKAGLSPSASSEGGKSGQRRASHFLTESYPQGWSNAEENDRLDRRQG